MLYCLSGSFKVMAIDGGSRSFETGDALLPTDANGKGHATEVTSSVPVNRLMIALA